MSKHRWICDCVCFCGKTFFFTFVRVQYWRFSVLVIKHPEFVKKMQSLIWLLWLNSWLSNISNSSRDSSQELIIQLCFLQHLLLLCTACICCYCLFLLRYIWKLVPLKFSVFVCSHKEVFNNISRCSSLQTVSNPCVLLTGPLQSIHLQQQEMELSPSYFIRHSSVDEKVSLKSKPLTVETNILFSNWLLNVHCKLQDHLTPVLETSSWENWLKLKFIVTYGKICSAELFKIFESNFSHKIF